MTGNRYRRRQRSRAKKARMRGHMIRRRSAKWIGEEWRRARAMQALADRGFDYGVAVDGPAKGEVFVGGHHRRSVAALEMGGTDCSYEQFSQMAMAEKVKTHTYQRVRRNMVLAFFGGELKNPVYVYLDLPAIYAIDTEKAKADIARYGLAYHIEHDLRVIIEAHKPQLCDQTTS